MNKYLGASLRVKTMFKGRNISPNLKTKTHFMWWLINASVTVFISSALVHCFLSCLEYAFVIKKTVVPNTQFISVYHTEEVDYDLIFLWCAHNIKCRFDLLLLIFSFLRKKRNLWWQMSSAKWAKNYEMEERCHFTICLKANISEHQ